MFVIISTTGQYILGFTREKSNMSFIDSSVEEESIDFFYMHCVQHCIC